MMRLILTLLGIFLFSATFAASKPIYQITCHLTEGGKEISSSSVMIEEGREGIVSSMREEDGTSLAATIRPITGQNLSVDYRFKTKKDKKSIEIAKWDAPFTSGQPETNQFQDSSGNNFKLTINVTKQ